MFRYESVNSTRKFTIVAEIVSLLKKIYKRDAPFRAVFKVKTLAVFVFGLSPRNETHTAKFKSAAILALLVSMEMVQSIPTRGARGLSMRTHLTAVEPLATSGDLWPSPTPEVRDSRTSRHSVHVQSQV